MKYLSTIIVSLFVFTISVTPAFAQESLGWPFLLVEQADGMQEYVMGSTPIIDYFDNSYAPDAENEGYPELTLYTHEDCGHCRIVEEYLDETNQRGLVVEKGLKNDVANMTELENTWAELNPDVEIGTESEDSSPNYVLLGAGVLVILAIVIYGVASVFSKEE